MKKWMLLLFCCLILGVQGCGAEGREHIEIGEDANEGFGGSGLERDYEG